MNGAARDGHLSARSRRSAGADCDVWPAAGDSCRKGRHGRRQLSGIQKQNEIQRQAERSVKQIQTTFERRLLQIEDEFSDIRNKQTDLESEGKILDRKINARLRELMAVIAQQDHKMEDNLQKEIDRNHSPENLYPLGKIHQVVEELSTRLLHREMQLREEIQKRFFDLEKSRFRLPELYMKLDDNIKKLTATFTDDMNWIEKVIKSEILERIKQGTQLGDKMDELQERLSLALTTLQEALGTLQEDLKSEMKKTEEMQAKLAESPAEQNTKLKEDFQDRDIESVCRTMGTLFADIYRIKEETPGEIAKIKENLMVCIEAIKSLRSDLIRLKSKANLEQENDTRQRNQRFVKDFDVTESKTINRWGIYQAVRWMQWKTNLKNKIQKLRLKDQRNNSSPVHKDN
ncbi:coiled-coil domain-containing protein 154-like isoform X2 [Rhincodon typus]|uniref:coiled-coil domain-containing protein 154-like isoform X2 n=1 Tax=Rhincodon typus TaxID=259920 RepID=UPI00202F0444|nr:coiled-coil domain-containing protein 154-like isoform X2 [Rhincodon typus]